ncbi:hypothetical protein [Paracoccus beibuensis]|uniref:hypothetical protein n=1 Tax=Paracoccus beibuensis TaxID=547602 RepID=UPI00223F69F8|nr:hypothetical protein [Paracoccus beibuensis]
MGRKTSPDLIGSLSERGVMAPYCGVRAYTCVTTEVPFWTIGLDNLRSFPDFVQLAADELGQTGVGGAIPDRMTLKGNHGRRIGSKFKEVWNGTVLGTVLSTGSRILVAQGVSADGGGLTGTIVTLKMSPEERCLMSKYSEADRQESVQPVLKSETRQSDWRRANLPKYKAHLAVHKALVSGRLQKQSCEVCGAETVDAHHDRYDEPLNVRWLCRRHHVMLHFYGEDMFPIRGRSGLP